jgi:Flp pilus assembly protein TadG
MAAFFTRCREGRRAGAALVELSLLLPVLIVLLLAAMDYSRVFYASIVVSNCARNGALYASDPNIANRTQYSTILDAVQADAVDLNSALLQVTEIEGTDATGYAWAEVTVTYPFDTVVNYPGIPSHLDITRTIRMRKVPLNDTYDTP